MQSYLSSAMILLIFLGCRTVDPVFNLRDAPVPASVGSAQQVAAAIKRAGYQLGWRINEVDKGRLEGVLELRSHRVVVDIPYSATEYSILYRESLNMQFNKKENTIHNKYDSWILNLNKHIRAQWRGRTN